MVGKRKFKIKNIVCNIPVIVILTSLALLVLIPTVWMMLSAFKSEKEIISWPPTFIPNRLTLENFQMYKDGLILLNIQQTPLFMRE